MRISHKLMLLAVTALAAMAFGASSASAQVEVLDEAASAHCNPCTGTVTGSTTLETHLFGSEQTQSQCSDSFDVVVDEAGTGTLHNQVLTGPNCTRQACDSAAESEWTGGSASETGPSQTTFNVDFCLEPTGGGDERHCTVPVVATETAHSWELEVHADCSGFPTVEVDGHYDQASGDDLEVVHL